MPPTAHSAASDIPTSDLAAELRAILTGAAFTPLKDLGWLRITGPDATRWLNGMVTNAVNALAPGEGCYNFLLNAQGRILGDCTIYRDPASEADGISAGDRRFPDRMPFRSISTASSSWTMWSSPTSTIGKRES